MTVSSRPLMHRTVHYGALGLIVGVLQFIAAMIVAQFGYPNYSLAQNYISDLGNTSLSPWYYVFDGSIAALGILTVVGVLLIWSAFTPGSARAIGLLLLGLAGVAAICVGVFPENLNGTAHAIASLLVFAPSGVGLLLLGGGAMPTRTHWAPFRAFTIALGAVTLVALVIFLFGVWGPLGPGTVERIVVAPVLLWALVISTHLLRLPARAPSRFVSRV
ncbi:MAG: DUF998 domain-containing protein [Thermoplasmata archaeon]|nr:DUF998 domain-containing protein [Thermoplasmata archaeon]